MKLMTPAEKPVVWMGSSRKDIAKLPEDVRREFGYVLDCSMAKVIPVSSL